MRTQARVVDIDGGTVGLGLSWRPAELATIGGLPPGMSGPDAWSAPGTEIEVEILGARRGGAIAEAPAHDPEGLRMRM